MDGLPDIRANGSDRYTMERFEQRLEARFRGAWAAARAGTLFNGLVGVIFAVGMGAALLLAVVLHGSGAVSLGEIYVVFRYAGMLQEPVEQLSKQINGLQQAAGGILRVRELLNTESPIRGGVLIDSVKGASAVRFESVGFDYGAGPVLHDVSFQAGRGEVLGVLGRTGSGKTTLTRLLFRLFDPTAGRIYLDDVDIRSLKLESLREHIGLVTQDVQLFQGTIKDNVALFNPATSNGRVEEALTVCSSPTGSGPSPGVSRPPLVPAEPAYRPERPSWSLWLGCFSAIREWSYWTRHLPAWTPRPQPGSRREWPACWREGPASSSRIVWKRSSEPIRS